MHAQVAHILQDLEALAAGAADIIVDDELIHDPLQQRQIPAASPHPLDFLVGKPLAAQVVAVGGIEVFDLLAGGFPV